MALGASGAAGARVLRRRGPKNSPLTAAVAGLAAEPPSDVDAMLYGLDLDAEFRSILAQADGREPEEVAETDRSGEVVSTPS